MTQKYIYGKNNKSSSLEQAILLKIFYELTTSNCSAMVCCFLLLGLKNVQKWKESTNVIVDFLLEEGSIEKYY
jgi:hypothetical protein